jgi:hypothetical protein
LGAQIIQNQNQFEFQFFNGQFVDEPISTVRPWKKFFLVAPASAGDADTLIVFLISFQKLNLGGALPFGQLPPNMQAFPLYFSRLLSNGNNQFNPMIEFECPFTEFYVNAWGISAADGTVQNCAVTLVCCDKGIHDYKTEPAPIIQVG